MSLLCEACRERLAQHQKQLAAIRRANGSEKGGRPPADPRAVRRALRMLNQKNPPTVEAAAKACGLSASTVRRAMAREGM